MTDTVPGKVRGILTRPLETFRAVREGDTRSVFRYFISLLLADAVLTALVSLRHRHLRPAMAGPAPSPPGARLFCCTRGLVLAPLFFGMAAPLGTDPGRPAGFFPDLQSGDVRCDPQPALWMAPRYRDPLLFLGHDPCHIRDPRTPGDRGGPGGFFCRYPAPPCPLTNLYPRQEHT